MSMILLAVGDAQRDAPVRDLLTAEGWWVTTVASSEEALRAAADHAPQLIIIDESLPGSDRLAHAFNRDKGGPGVLFLADESATEGPTESGDGRVLRGTEDQAFVEIVRASIEAPRQASGSPEPTSQGQFTSSELFGDILQDLGGPEESEPSPQGGEETVPFQTLVVREVESIEQEIAAGEASTTESAETVFIQTQPPEKLPSETVGTDAALPSEVEDWPEEVQPVDPTQFETPIESESSDGILISDNAELATSIDTPVDKEVEQAIESAFEEVKEQPEEGVVELEAVEVEQAPEPEAQPEVEVEPEPESEVEPEVEAEPEPEPEIEVEPEAKVEPEVEEPEQDSSFEETIDQLLEDPDAEVWAEDDDPPAEDDEAALSIAEVLAVEEPPVVAEEAEEVEPKAPPPEFDEDVLGGYRLKKVVEFGEFSEHWLAESIPNPGRNVSLHRLRPEFEKQAHLRQAFVDGSSEAAAWEHENILAVLDLGRDTDVDFVVSDYEPGHSLEEVLGRVRGMEIRMPLGIALYLSDRVARALVCVESGSGDGRHGWLTPRAVWLTESGGVKLRNFGTARFSLADREASPNWSEQRFIAPERLKGEGDIRSDLYSVGALLYEMMSARPLHEGSDPETLRRAIAGTSIPSAQKVDPTIPSEIDRWLNRLLRKDPAERLQASTELVSLLDLALQALPARTGNRELNAYLRQLFAARAPVHAPLPTTVVTPVEASPVDAQHPDAEQTDEAVQDREVSARPWWIWLIGALLVVLFTLFAWSKMRDRSGEVTPAQIERAEGASAEETSEPPTVEVSAPGIETATAEPAAIDSGDELDVSSIVEEQFQRRARESEERLGATATDPNADEASDPSTTTGSGSDSNDGPVNSPPLRD